MAHSEVIVRVVSTRKLVVFQAADTTLNIKYPGPKPQRECLILHSNVIYADFDRTTRTLTLSYLANNKKKGHLPLVRITGEVQDMENDMASEWAEALMRTVYEDCGVSRSRRVRVLVNPHSGIRKGAAIFTQIVEPILRAAHCPLDITHTTHNGHAHEIAKTMSLDYDAVITVSGDGLIHEVMNGFANHSDPMKAFAIPIAPIPTGSGNGLSLNLLGIENGFDISIATLNVIKGRPMKVDLFSLTQSGKRTISFMSQALGLMADLDIGTENLRWMGDARFVVGLFRGIIQFKPCPVQLSFKIAEQDKEKMAQIVQARRLANNNANISPSGSGQLPPLKYLPDDSDGWTTFDEPLLYVYAGKGPYVGRDMMAFPVSLPDDGLIDVMAMPLSSRKDVLANIPGAAKGENYWYPKLHYVKAHAYRVRPLSDKGCLAVDGEVFPFKEFQVEVHQGLGTLLSPHGYYAVDFPTRPPTNKLKVK